MNYNMGRTIKVFSDTSILEYDRGNFDDWCIYLTRPKIERYPPLDIQYFARFQELGAVHTNQKIYDDYVKVFNQTTKVIDPAVLSLISDVASNYLSDVIEIDILFSIVYAGMVAEENKAYTKLGKRIKRLGMHQTLIENQKAHFAANFSRGKGWRDLDAICKERGF
jgi:hypothetical protein